MWTGSWRCTPRTWSSRTTPAVCGSKVVVLVAIVAAQSVVFTLLALLGRDPPDDPVILGSAYLEVLEGRVDPHAAHVLTL